MGDRLRREAVTASSLSPRRGLATVRPNGYPRRVRNLVQRPRRLRRSAGIRNLVRETKLTAHDFVLPLFVSEKLSARQPISSMPGVFQLAPGDVAEEAQRAHDLGLQAVLLFGIPREKDEAASGAYAEQGVVQEAVRAIKSQCPEIVV